MMMPGRIAVVTGASRGAGRGIAIALGSHGFTVYVTGRSERPGDAPLPGTIHETAAAVTAAGGRGIAVRVDHADDDQVRTLFDQVRRDHGRLDLLVNNACALHDRLTDPGPFWEKPLEIVGMLDVGLRSGYVASYLAAPLLVESAGMIVFTSASGSVHYVFGPAYGAHKAGVDKFAADMAIDFRDAGVTVCSIWMGTLLTERLRMVIASDPVKYRNLEAGAESPELTGHAIAALFDDSDRLAQSGRTLIGAELATLYRITDEGGRRPVSARDTHGVAPRDQHPLIIR